MVSNDQSHRLRPNGGQIAQAGPHPAVFHRNGEFWTVGYRSHQIAISDLKGMAMIERLLRSPGDEISAYDLVYGPAAPVEMDANPELSEIDPKAFVTSQFTDSGELLDEQAKQEYKQRLRDLQENLEELRARGDSEQAAGVEQELEFLRREIARAFGLGGRSRRAGSAMERARLNASRAIRAAVLKISEHDAEFAEHLSAAIKTGLFCCYRPKREDEMIWEFASDSLEPPATSATETIDIARPEGGENGQPTLHGASAESALPPAEPVESRPARRNYRIAALVSVAGLVLAALALVLNMVVVRHSPVGTPARPLATLPAPDLASRPSIAVLPFANMSGDREQEYFSDGITDDLITDLSRLPGLFVIARESTFTYKGKPPRLQDVSRELGVKYVLSGGVRKAAGQLRITAQLTDATTGALLWAERYDRPLRDIFALQDDIVRRIVTTLNLELALSQKGLMIPRSTENLDAYDYLLHGMEYLSRATKEGYERARPMFEKAVELDPNYAWAFSALGLNYCAGWTFGFNPDRSGAGSHNGATSSRAG